MILRLQCCILLGIPPSLGRPVLRLVLPVLLQLVSLPRCLPVLLRRCLLELLPLVRGHVQVLPLVRGQLLPLVPHPPPAWIVECGCEV